MSILTVIAMLLGCGSADSKKAMPKGRLLSVEFEKTARSIWPEEYYLVNTDDNGKTWITNISQDGDTMKVAANENLLSELRDIIEQDKLYRLKERYTPFGDVRDGWHWRFVARFENDEKIYSECTNTKPGSLSLDRIRKALSKAFESSLLGAEPKGELVELRYEKLSSRAEPVKSFTFFVTERAFGHGKEVREPIKFYELQAINPKFHESPDSEKYINKNISAEQAEKITEIVKTYRMDTYGDYPSPEGIHDGYSWRLKIVFSTGKSFESQGRNNKPENGGLKVFTDYLDSICSK
ncbi:MAG: hypothetical protein IK120_03470 [Muribaculaceae bacterium]|nr:hypothetical protein [Muribaculaceae bacterium]